MAAGGIQTVTEEKSGAGPARTQYIRGMSMAEKKLTLAESVAEKLIEDIGEKGLKPGDKLGTEKELMEAMNVSRSTLREAIRLLVSRQILESRHGSGTYVSDGTGVVPDPLGLELLHDKFKLTWDLLEIRLLLEPQLTAAAALNATDEQIAEMEELCDEMDRLSSIGADRMAIDTQFHMRVLEASGNLVASNLLPIMKKAVDLFIIYTQRETSPETVATHRQILDGIRRHDPEWAKDMMHMHLEFNRQEFRRVAIERGEDLSVLKGGN